MSATQTIHDLRTAGYTLSLTDQGNIRAFLPDGLPEAPALLDRLREFKPEAVQVLRDEAAGLRTVLPSEGAFHEEVFEGEGAITRWSVAVNEGLIHLTDKVQFSRASGKCCISFRCAMPLEWLKEATVRACVDKFAQTSERIFEAEEWLKVNQDSLEYSARYSQFLVWLERLRLLWLAIGEE